MKYYCFGSIQLNIFYEIQPTNQSQNSFYNSGLAGAVNAFLSVFYTSQNFLLNQEVIFMDYIFNEPAFTLKLSFCLSSKLIDFIFLLCYLVQFSQNQNFLSRQQYSLCQKMFEKLLQKILKEVIGQFTEQIDTNNLSVGIWSGQITINKVVLNKNLFKKFNLPISIVFSYIAQLKIKIPWKSFFSSPLIINIDSAFALCQIDPIQMSLEDKKVMIINSIKLLITNIGKKVLQKTKLSQESQAGYFQTIFKKMFDNLYLNIKNVHFRFQNVEKMFSFGLYVASIDIHAVDQSLEPIFIDRAKMKDNEKFVRRKFEISKLMLYGNSKQQDFLSQKTLKQKSDYFKNSKNIYQTVNKQSAMRIFYIDIKGLITQNYTSKIPYYEIEINQQKIQINLKKQIIEQFLLFAKQIQSIVETNTKKVVYLCSEKGGKFLKSFCIEYLADYKGNQKTKDSKIKEVLKNGDEQLSQLIDLDKSELANLLEKILINDIGKQNLLKSLGVKQIEQQTIENQNGRTSCIKIHTILPKVLVYLFSQQNKAIFELNLAATEAKYETFGNKSQLNLFITSIQIFSQQSLKLLSIKQKQKKSFELSVTTNQNTNQIQLSFEKINFVYDSNIINSIKQFFTFTSIDTKLKNQALDKLQKIEYNVSKTIKKSQSLLSLNASISGLNIVFLHKQHQLILQSQEIRLIQNYKDSECRLTAYKISSTLLKNNNQDTAFKLIQPFEFFLKIDKKQSLIIATISQLTTFIDKEVYLFCFEFVKIFSGKQKQQMIKKSDLMGQIFVKEYRWKKTLCVLYRGKLFLWDQNDQYPKLTMRVRKAKQIVKGKLTYLIVSDKTNQIQIATKTQKQYSVWKAQLEKIVQIRRNSEKGSSISSISQKKQKQAKFQIKFKLCKINFHLLLKSQTPIDFNVEDLIFQNFDREQINKNNEIFLVGIKNCSINQKKIIFQNRNKTQTPFFLCKIKSFPQFYETTSSIEVLIERFSLNFDPVFIILLSSFLAKNQQPNQNLYVLKSHETLNQQDQNKILMNVVLRMNDSIVMLQNKKSKLNIASISFMKLNIEIKIKYYQLLISGRADSIRLQDLSGYPNTIYEKVKYQQSKPNPQDILCQEKTTNSIEFIYSTIEKGSAKYQSKKKDLLKLNFMNFKLNYINQVFFRLVDYLFVQLIGSITQSDFFQQYYGSDKNQFQMQEQHIDFKRFIKNKNQIIRSKALAKLDKKKLQKFLFESRPFYLQLSFFNTTINIVSETIQNGIRFQIEEILVENQIKLVQAIQNQEVFQLVTQFFNIQLKNIMACIIEKESKSILNSEPFSMKTSIQMFKKDLQYIYLYGPKDIFTSHINIDLDIDTSHFQFRSENIVAIQKFLLYNQFHDDGLDFMMIYDYMDLMPEMKIQAKIFSEALSLQIIHEQERFLVDAGNFTLSFFSSKKQSQKKVQFQYIVIHYAFKQLYQEILTSRKNFGKFQFRKTLFKSYLTMSQIQKEDCQSIFSLQIKSQEQKKIKQYIFSIQEVMLIFNVNFLLLIKKILLKRQHLQPFEKMFKEKSVPSVKIIEQQNIYKFLANKIIVCCKLPDSKGMILALLFTFQFKQNKIQKGFKFPHLEAFVSNQNEISNQNIDLIKKRTILRPTQIKYTQNKQLLKFSIQRVFLKISVNDLKELIKLIMQLKHKLNQLAGKQIRLSNKVNLSRISGSNESVYNTSRNSEQTNINDQIKASKIFSFGALQLMIINDIQDNLIPLLYGNMILNFQNQGQALNLEVKVDFFNIRNSFWQPFFESTKFQISFSPYLSVKTSKQQFANINISTNLIENFYKTMNHGQIVISRLHNEQQQIGYDQINSWVIINQIGQLIICRSSDQQNEVSIESGQSARINFLTNYQQNFNQNKTQQKQVFVNIIIGDKLQIKQLNINELGLKKISFIYRQQKCVILKNLIVDISKNVRYLTLSSTLQLQNKTDLSIQFYALDQERFLNLQPKSNKFIPFNITSSHIFLNNIFQIQQREPSNSILFNLEQTKLNQKDQLNLQTISNLNKIHFKSISFKIKLKYEKMKKIISFEPFYLFKNYLPQQLIIVLRDKVQKNMLNQYILQGVNSPSKQNYSSVYHEIDDAQVNFYIQGYQWTNFEEFQSKKRIQLKSYSNQIFQIRVFRNQQIQKTSEIIFYYPLVLKNKTIQQIKVHSKKINKNLTKILKIDESQSLLSREVILEIKGQLSQEVYLKHYSQFFVFSKMINNLKVFSKYFVLRNFEKISQNLTLTELKLYNKYLIKNETQSDILIKPFSGKTGQVQHLEKGETTDLLFFQINSKISIGSMFQVCPKNSQYQWSHPLNLVMIKQSTFFIRSRFQFHKLKHYIIEVSKHFEYCYLIRFREILKEQCIPFLIMNKCQKKIIEVKNILQKIQSKQSIFFNWEDPFQNSNLIVLQIKEGNKQSKLFTLDVNQKQSTKFNAKEFDKSVQVQTIIQLNRKIIIFKDQEQDLGQQEEQIKNFVVELPIRLSLINNSISPVVHVFDFSTKLKLEQITVHDRNILKAELNLIQIDNQANYNPLFPVILSTSINLVYKSGKNSSLLLQTKQINLKIQEDLIKSLSTLKIFFQNLLKYETTKIQSSTEKKSKSDNLFISKLILPKIMINLQVQTKNFSLQTAIGLQKPQICSFPWKQFPYPIKKIVLNILSHLSISPWAFVTSFKKGVEILLTSQSTGTAFQGFFGTLLGAISNSLSGILGFIVGYDVQKVDNLIDGLDQGFRILFTEIKQIPEFQSYNLGSILQGTGKTLINLVFKPIKGILRMTLKITEGIKKTAQFSFDQLNQIKTRLPIVFYNHQQYFLAQNQQESQNLQMFREITGNKIEYFYLVKFFKLQLILDKIDLLLILGTQFIVLLNLTKRKIIWVIEISKIKFVEVVDVCKIKIFVSSQLQSNARIPSKRDKMLNQTKQMNQYQIFMMNENQAVEVLETYLKIKKFQKIQF